VLAWHTRTRVFTLGLISLLVPYKCLHARKAPVGFYRYQGNSRFFLIKQRKNAKRSSKDQQR
jgi:hypothetical protein